MEKMLCPSCGAALTPDTAKPALVCEYCDTPVPNPYYVESDAKAAAQPTLKEMCVAALLEMGKNARLADLDENCFGDPIQRDDTARAAMDIPDREKLYFFYNHESLLGAVLGTVSEGLALTENGLYYLCGGKKGSLSWESFITGAIACEDRASWQQEGTLRIGSSISVGISSEADSQLARFLVDFHNRVYHQYTGQTAPASWAVTEQAAEPRVNTGSVLTGAGLAGTVLTAAKSLLQRNAMQRHVVQRPAVNRVVRKPVPQRRHMQQPARPAMTQPVHRQRPQEPGGMFRPGGGHGRHGGPGGPGGMGRMGGPGRGRR